jgi:hypothetical protein
MPTISEIARNLGFSRQYVQRCVHDGCPTDTFENARLWFGAHRQFPRKPLKAAEEPDDSQETRTKRKERLDKSEEWEPKNGTLDEALESSVRACNEAWKLLDEAFIEGKPGKIGTWLNLHNKAVEARVKVERLIREEMERQRVLITMVEAQTSTRRVVEIVVSRLSALPQNLAHAVNPSAPDHAFEILQRECTAIVSDTQKAIAT